jgi:cellulose synthase/poly-beta-1,6-N-acetylglucosamine synthase-like glycosyltransferase
MNRSLSIIIPVYKESNLLEPLLQDLINDIYPNKEIIVTIDEPTENSIRLSRKYEKSCHFTLNRKRLGRAKALNMASEKASGEIFVFLDSDIKIKTKNFLTEIERQMDVDLLEMKKEVLKEGFISELVKYDYITLCITSTLFDKIKRCIGINGSGFAITKEFFRDVSGFRRVISDDLEIGLQVYLRNRTYKFVKDIIIYQKTPNTWKGLFNQKKRWSIGSSQFFQNHYRELTRLPFKYTKMTFISFFFWPTLLTIILMRPLVEPLVEKAMLVVLFGLSLKFSFLLPVLLFTTLGFLLFKNFIVFLIMYGVSASLFWVASRKLKFNYSNKNFIIYYLFYSPLFFLIFLYYFISSFFKKNYLINWKV